MRASVARLALVAVASVCLTISSAILPDSIARAASQCLAKPNAPPPQGKHWYYRSDRVEKRRCWYLAAKGRPDQADGVGVASPEQRPAARRVRSAAAPVPPPRTIGDLVRELNTEAPAKAQIGEASSQERVLQSASPASGAPAAPGALDRAPTLMGETASDEPKTEANENRAPPPGPVIAAAEPVSGEHPLPLTAQPAIEQPAATGDQPTTSEQPTTSWSALMLFASLFAFAGLLGRAAYRRAAARRLERLELERRLAAASEMFPGTSPQTTFAAEVGHWADIARRQPLPTDDRFEQTEDAVRALLRASHARHREHAA